MAPEQQKAELWSNPKMLADVEQGRYAVERALRELVSRAVNEHMKPNSVVVELGAGLGYLKTLFPLSFQEKYISSDYSSSNVSAGKAKRPLEAMVVDAHQLPFRDSSVDSVVNMDAFDTMPSLDKVLAEVHRVLKPGGLLMHFQINLPSDDTLLDDFPEYVFFPPELDKKKRPASMVGVKKENLSQGISRIKTRLFKNIVQRFVDDPFEAYVELMLIDKNGEFAELLNKLVDVIPGEKLNIPSLPAYFKDKLERTAEMVGFNVVESGFRQTSFVGKRSDLQPYSHNQFEIVHGASLWSINPELVESKFIDVIEKVAMLVFVARKPQG